MSSAPIYLDHNATTPPAPEVVQAVAECMAGCWGNASSTHAAGQASRQALAAARAAVATALGCKPAEVVFTSGATEAYHMALHGALRLSPRRRLVLGEAEHASARKLGRRLHDELQLQGGGVDWIGLRPDGSLDLDEARRLITPEVALVSVLAASNETGVLMPMAELAALAHAVGAWLHVDATQWVGKLPFSLATFAGGGADLVSLSAHKFNGPKGVGALLVRSGLALPAWQVGSQERGRRGGTENLPGIVGMAAALRRLQERDLAADAVALAARRDRLQARLQQALPGTVVFGGAAPRLPNTLYLRFGALHADQVLGRLERAGVLASSGSACSSGGSEPSPVLIAMGVSREDALCAVRLTLGADTADPELDRALDAITAALQPVLPSSTLFPPDSGAPDESDDPQNLERQLVAVCAEEGPGGAHRRHGAT